MGIFVGAGAILTQQVGFSAVNYFDPSMAQSTGPFERLISWTMIILIISSGALIPMFQGLLISFKSLNFNELVEAKDFSNYYFYFFKSAFASILMLSSYYFYQRIDYCSSWNSNKTGSSDEYFTS